MTIFYVLFTICAGIMSALESGSNNTLQKGVRAPWWTIVIVSAMTLAIATGAALTVRDRWPGQGSFAALPWYGWIGGAFAFVFVASTVFAAPRLGAGTFIAIVVTTSTITSLVLDNYGLMHFPVHPASWGRIAGAGLMVAGVSLIARF